MTKTPSTTTTTTSSGRRGDYAALAKRLGGVLPYPLGPVPLRRSSPEKPMTASDQRELGRLFSSLRDLPPTVHAPYERLIGAGDLVPRSHLHGKDGPNHVHSNIPPADEQSRIIRTLRGFFGDRPPLFGQVPRSALAAGAAAVVEVSAQVRLYGETVGHRPAGDLARTVLEAGAPYIQRDILQRVAGDRVWMQGWWVLGQVVAATVGLACAVVFGVVAGVTWLTVVAGCAFALHTFGLHQIWSSNRRQLSRAKQLLRRPSPEAGDATVDIKGAQR